MYMYHCDDHNYRHIIIIFTLYSQWLFFLNVINSIFFFSYQLQQCILVSPMGKWKSLVLLFSLDSNTMFIQSHNNYA